jgi:cytochrome c
MIRMKSEGMSVSSRGINRIRPNPVRGCLLVEKRAPQNNFLFVFRRPDVGKIAKPVIGSPGGGRFDNVEPPPPKNKKEIGMLGGRFYKQATPNGVLIGQLQEAGLKSNQGSSLDLWKIAFSQFLLIVFSLPSLSSFAENYDPTRFEKETIVPACVDAVQCEITPDGRVYFIERAGALKSVEPVSKKVTTLGTVPVEMTWEVGLLGLALDQDFAHSQQLFLFFSPKSQTNTMRLARFSLKDGLLDLNSEKVLLEFTNDWTRTHQGGGLFMAANGDLLLGTGDNMYPFPEVPVDERPGPGHMDSQATSANSMSLRGKILRIHPTSEGAYTIPQGNLFADGKHGRAEIFAMGVRNGFRQYEDPKTGFIYWGDVGQNIATELGIGPNGYDEVNQARKAGNFGWPYFTGPNEAYRKFDFVTRKAGDFYDVKAPRNDSPNNYGTHELPPPEPAFIWYPTEEAKQFPMLGSGGRSAMVGPVYHFDPSIKNEFKMPDHFDHSLFIFDWMRNWIQAVHLDSDEHIADIERFLPETRFRKPIDIKLAPDHTLYVIEYGDKWANNDDSQIVRLIYRRGNRAPTAVAKASTTAGKLPLKIRFDASGSSDKDGDALLYKWKFGEAGEATGVAPEFKFKNSGTYPVTLTATDSHGASDSAHLQVFAGNAPPRVTFKSPPNGSFYDSQQQIAYQLRVDDDEDGSSEDDPIQRSRVMLEMKTALHAHQDDSLLPPGLALMRSTTCFGCHLVNDKSVGPPYVEVSKKYQGDPTARERLAQKILTGGVGIWSTNVPMPPHPQHNIQQTRQMVDWVLSLADASATPPIPGLSGTVAAPAFGTDQLSTPATLVLTASYTDNGANGVQPLRGETVAILHPRHERASASDAMKDAEVVDVFEGGEGNAVRLKDKGWFRFDTVNLAGIKDLVLRVAPLSQGTFEIEVHLDSPEGPLLGSQIVACMEQKDATFGLLTIPIIASAGLHNLYFVARNSAAPLFGRAFPLPSSGRIVDIVWIEFRESPLARSGMAPADGKRRDKVLFITTRLDHPWQSHMYSAVTELLATELNKRPDIEAIVSPEFDWPRDPKIFDGVKGIVYYSGAAGDLLISQHREAFTNLMNRGVGFSALHFATSATKAASDRYGQYLGGWWTVGPDSLAMGQVKWKFLSPNHPILHGLPEFTMSDEIYRHTTLSPQAVPLIQVHIADRDDVVAWAYEREGGGRSFGTTLGHPYANWSDWRIEPFRHMVLNGIRWTLGQSIAEKKTEQTNINHRS